jgi:hypothetical protein
LANTPLRPAARSRAVAASSTMPPPRQRHQRYDAGEPENPERLALERVSAPPVVVQQAARFIQKHLDLVFLLGAVSRGLSAARELHGPQPSKARLVSRAPRIVELSTCHPQPATRCPAAGPSRNLMGPNHPAYPAGS